MPKSDLHRRQRRKNFTLLFVLLGMVAGFFYLTIVKIRGV